MDEHPQDMDRLRKRLRRRKVVQWGIACSAAAWGLVPGVAYMRDTFSGSLGATGHDDRPARRAAHRPGNRVAPRGPRGAAA
jgi:hypothetical protein